MVPMVITNQIDDNYNIPSMFPTGGTGVLYE